MSTDQEGRLCGKLIKNFGCGKCLNKATGCARSPAILAPSVCCAETTVTQEEGVPTSVRKSTSVCNKVNNVHMVASRLRTHLFKQAVNLGRSSEILFKLFGLYLKENVERLHDKARHTG